MWSLHGGTREGHRVPPPLLPFLPADAQFPQNGPGNLRGVWPSLARRDSLVRLVHPEGLLRWSLTRTVSPSPGPRVGQSASHLGSALTGCLAGSGGGPRQARFSRIRTVVGPAPQLCQPRPAPPMGRRRSRTSVSGLALPCAIRAFW